MLLRLDSKVFTPKKFTVKSYGLFPEKGEVDASPFLQYPGGLFVTYCHAYGDAKGLINWLSVVY
jgi:hypothetical protein